MGRQKYFAAMDDFLQCAYDRMMAILNKTRLPDDRKVYLSRTWAEHVGITAQNMNHFQGVVVGDYLDHTYSFYFADSKIVKGSLPHLDESGIMKLVGDAIM